MSGLEGRADVARMSANVRVWTPNSDIEPILPARQVANIPAPAD